MARSHAFTASATPILSNRRPCKPMEHVCETCSAEPGEKCVNQFGQQVGAHRARRVAAIRARNEDLEKLDPEVTTIVRLRYTSKATHAVIGEHSAGAVRSGKLRTFCGALVTSNGSIAAAVHPSCSECRTVA